MKDKTWAMASCVGGGFVEEVGIRSEEEGGGYGEGGLFFSDFQFFLWGFRKSEKK